MRSESVDIYSSRARFVRTYKKYISISPNPPKYAQIKDTHICARVHTHAALHIYTYIHTYTHARTPRKSIKSV